MAILLSRRRRAWPFLWMLLCCAVNSAGAPGDQTEFTYRSSASEVRLAFSVVDQSHRAVPTLQAADFAVVDKGFIVRNFKSFTHADWTRLKIAVVVDASQSIAPLFQQELSGLHDFVSQTPELAQDNLAIVSFRGAEPVLLCNANCPAERTIGQLKDLRSEHLTPLFDSVVFASKALADDSVPDEQRVLLIFSDGMDTISRTSLRETINIALLNDIQIYSIDLNRPTSATGSAVLQSLAEATGGRYFPSDRGVSRAVEAILGDFHTSYVVTYQLPRRTAGFHAVQILPTHKTTLQFRSRSGYYFPDNVR